MGSPLSMPFACPNCDARYEVVRVEMDSAPDLQLTFRRCGGPLNGRESRFALKYFLVDRRGAAPKLVRRR